MSSQDAKNKETESKIMGAAEAVTALIDAVTKESADGVRAAAERFKKDTKSDIKSLGDANGRTPLHLVRALDFQPRRASRSRSWSTLRGVRQLRDRRRRSRALFSFPVEKKNPRLFDENTNRARESRSGASSSSPRRSLH